MQSLATESLKTSNNQEQSSAQQQRNSNLEQEGIRPGFVFGVQSRMPDPKFEENFDKKRPGFIIKRRSNSVQNENISQKGQTASKYQTNKNTKPQVPRFPHPSKMAIKTEQGQEQKKYYLNKKFFIHPDSKPQNKNRIQRAKTQARSSMDEYSRQSDQRKKTKSVLKQEMEKELSRLLDKKNKLEQLYSRKNKLRNKLDKLNKQLTHIKYKEYELDKRYSLEAKKLLKSGSIRKSRKQAKEQISAENFKLSHDLCWDASQEEKQRALNHRCLDCEHFQLKLQDVQIKKPQEIK